jgi:hypothetical protein
MPAITHPLVNIGPGPNQTPADTARDAFGKINTAIQALDGAVDAAGAAAAAAQTSANTAAAAASAAQATANTGVANASAAQTTANTAAANASAALAQIAARLDTITVDAAVVPSGTALPRVPDVLVVINTPPASPYWVVFPGAPNRAPAGKPLWVANRAAGTLRIGESTSAAPKIEVGSGVSALRVSMGGGDWEQVAVAGDTIPASQVSGLAAVATSGSFNDLSAKPRTLRTALFRSSAVTGIPSAVWRAIAFQTAEDNDLGVTVSEASRTFTLPAGVVKVRLTVNLTTSNVSASNIRATFSRNSSGVDTYLSFPGNMIESRAPATPAHVTAQTAWISASSGDVFRALGWMTQTGGGDFGNPLQEQWLLIEGWCNA